MSGRREIVKFWEGEYPELAANEYFCLRAAERCGLELPRFRLSDDGRALVVDRFDLRADGHYQGFEDFCVLNARSTADKYRGSYETAILKRFRDFASADTVADGSERLFMLIALNCMVRNGDAHLKNFGMLYDDIDGPVRLAPVYDIVTTTAYLPADAMALTLNGSTRWPARSQLQAFGETRQIGTPAAIRAILERVETAIAETIPEIETYGGDHPSFAQIGARMIAAWHEGLAKH
ncbi:HipA domain-containing protein [Sphingobium cloacae]|uniref:HipA-like C-terminal domain-containing protein n=2 Tax=Sphingobium cloacae TaxID=120107 RepID=A0A1E1F199_9SPHN|nr:HipA domain-containing protein [Sphingobium cloacae]BAV64231.1 hypothetical protein SCLO_1011910 [Sphingobium cloacae]